MRYLGRAAASFCPGLQEGEEGPFAFPDIALFFLASGREDVGRHFTRRDSPSPGTVTVSRVTATVVSDCCLHCLASGEE